jgi:glucosamine--fructose-6-phosphate aminotransferase (isomerizing)
VFARGQDLEEWSHVERFAHPTDMPLLVIAPPGRTHPRAVALAEQAHTLGRRVISIAGSDDHRFTAHAHTVLPITGQVREEFSPLLYHLPAGYLACFIASHLGRLPFQAPPRQTTSE